MSKPVDRIRTLISSLPDKDIPLGHKFIDIRDFESLKDLVDSALYKIKRCQDLENSKYKDICIEDLEKLKSEVDWYCTQLDIELSDYEYDTEENIIEEEYY